MRTMTDAELRNLMIRACSEFSVEQQDRIAASLKELSFSFPSPPDLILAGVHIRQVTSEVIALIAQKDQMAAVLQSARKIIEQDKSSLSESSKDPKTNQVTCEFALAGLAEYAIVLNKIDKITRGEI